MNICKLAINHVLCVALLCGSALAYKCSEDFYCEDGRLGIGGYYSSFGSNAVTSDNVGGYYHYQMIIISSGFILEVLLEVDMGLLILI